VAFQHRKPASSPPSRESAGGLETAVDKAIAACGGDMPSSIRASIVANEFLIRSE
jgi:hypothetical protein